MQRLHGESMESTECVNNGIKCWCVDAKKETRVKKTRKEKSEKHGKREGKKDKQGREEGLACQHAAISAFISAEHSDTRGRSPWRTASMNAVCLAIPSQQQEPSENTMQTHTVAFLLWVVRKSDLNTTNHTQCQRHQKSHKQASQS